MLEVGKLNYQIKVAEKPTECWILKVVWDNGDVSRYPTVESNLSYQPQITNPLTGNKTRLDLSKAREWGLVRGTISRKPKGNPLNDDDHYDNPEN